MGSATQLWALAQALGYFKKSFTVTNVELFFALALNPLFIHCPSLTPKWRVLLRVLLPCSFSLPLCAPIRRLCLAPLSLALLCALTPPVQYNYLAAPQ